MKAKLVKENMINILAPKSKEDILKQLSNLSQEEKDNKLLDVAQTGQLEVVKYLIEVGSNVDTKDNNGFTPLMLASYYNYLDVIKILIEAGANVNAKNKYGDTALRYALINGYIEIAELLKKYGAKE